MTETFFSVFKVKMSKIKVLACTLILACRKSLLTIISQEFSHIYVHAHIHLFLFL